jgi:hypothetical protein
MSQKMEIMSNFRRKKIAREPFDAMALSPVFSFDHWAQLPGGSLPPVDLMRVTGIEMTDPEPLRSTARLFGRLVTELEQSMQ